MSPFTATWDKAPNLGIASLSSSGRNPDFVASPSRFTSNNTAWVSPASRARREISSANWTLSTEWIRSKPPTTDRTFRRCKRPIKCQRTGSPRSASIFGSASWSRLSPRIVRLRQSPRGSGRGPPILLRQRGERSHPAVQIAESHVGSARKRAEDFHRSNHQPVDPSHLISHSYSAVSLKV